MARFDGHPGPVARHLHPTEPFGVAVFNVMSTTTPPKINRWTVFSEAIKSWPTTLCLLLLSLAWSVPAALVAWLAHR